MNARAGVPLAWLWALSLVLVWIAIAFALHHDVPVRQPSQALVAFGAIKGRDLTASNA